MKTKTKIIFDLFEEAFIVPILCMLLIITALGYSNNSNQKPSYLDGQIDHIYCQNDGIYGTNIYASGTASSTKEVSRLRLRFLKDNQTVNNFYLANPIDFKEKEITSYSRNALITMQAYDSLNGEFYNLDETTIDCSRKVAPTYSFEDSYIMLNKESIKADGKDFAILEIKLVDQFGEPLVGEPVDIILTDEYSNGKSHQKEVSDYYTDHHGKIQLQVVYDLSEPKTDKVKITFAVGDVMHDETVELKYIFSEDNVYGEIDFVKCNYSTDYNQLINIEGHAIDPDDSEKSIKLNFYMSEYFAPQKMYLGSAFTENNRFGITINREIFDFGDSIDAFAIDLQSGDENYIGQINPNCQAN